MGVTGLWKLIEQCGTPVPLETLENKVLAVDISIWLHQSVKGFQDASGAGLPHAHLLGLYHRICKLLYYRIRPVFVFDGGIPYLKKETMRKRMANKNTYRAEADRLQKLLAQSVEREKLIRHALGEPSTSTALVSPQKDRLARPDKDDMFVLPPIPENEVLDSTSSSLDQSTSSVEECTQKTYNVNLHTIDVTGKHFLSLPADVRHEILTDIKGMRKESSWGRLHELPDESNEFSGFQMQRLLKRRQVQKSLEAAEQEMGGTSMTFGEIEQLLREDGIVEADIDTLPTNRLHSDENTRYLHVRNLKKAMRAEEKKISAFKEEEDESKEGSPPKKRKVVENMLEVEEDDFEEEDEQLQRAIQMSLEECQIVAGRSMSDIVIPFVDIKTETEETIIESEDSDVSSNADSDFIEVPEDASDTSLTLPSLLSFELNIAAPPDPSTDFRHADLKLFDGKPAGGFEVIIDPEQKPLPHEDLFADIFKVENEVKEIKEFTDLGKIVAYVPAMNDSLDTKTVKLNPAEIKTSPTNLESILSNLNAEMDSLVKKDSELFGMKNGKTIDIKQDSIVLGTVAQLENNELISRNSPEVIDETSVLPSYSNENMIDLVDDELIDSIVVDSSKDATNPSNELVSVIASKTTENVEDYDNVSPIISVLESPSNLADEIIEIDDDDENTQPKVMKQTNIAQFVQITPTKMKPVVKNIETTPPPKIASPFYRKKTPSSSKKIPPDNSSPSPRKSSQKSLFQDTPENNKKTHEDVLIEVATELREQVNVGELKEMAQESRQNTRDLLMERNKQDRMGSSITDRMSDDCKRLLRIFGVPFVVAPMEAEAQCAYLDAARLTDGTITDDSDIWLFGGRTVYKHFFNQAKSVQEFRSESVKRLFNVERENLIQMAMLVGSDYTTGVAGIGMVTALEILSSFHGTPSKDSVCNEQELLAKLRKFKEWLTNSKLGTNVRLRTKLKNVALADEFPSTQVVHSYLYPEVNDKLESFSWRAPDAETLREFAKATFGWTFSKTNETLLPVLKKLEEKKSQLSIRNYFASQGIIDRKEVTVSKRVRKAIDQMANGNDAEVEQEEVKDKPKRSRKPKTAKPSTESKTGQGEADDKPKPTTRGGRVPRDQPSTSSAASKSPLKSPRIPDFQPPIRQRELAAAQQEKIKAEAIALFKQANKRNARKKK